MAVNKYRTACEELLFPTGIKFNGDRPWDIKVHDERFYKRVISEGSMGFGESYMDGWWDCDELDDCVNRMLRSNLEKKVKGSWKLIFYALRARLFNLQNITRAFEVGEKHYDAGNDLYKVMLDKRLAYTCGYWKDARNLDEAQEAKLDLVCRKLCLEAGMSVLELGCGFGSFAKYAAEKYGARVLGVTVSREQVALGSQLCRGLPVEIRLQDYRTVTGKFDRVISIGILEHVGHKNYMTYMQTVDRCLDEGGIAFIHTVGGNFSDTAAEDPWFDKYIFPNGMFPSIAQIGKAMERIFIIEDLHNFGPDYDKTLMAWHQNFKNAWPKLKGNYSDRFYRMWRYYLLSMAGCFRARRAQLWQMVMTRPGTAQPACRFS